MKMFRTMGILLSAASLAALVACSSGTPATTPSDESPAEQGATTDQKPVEQPAQ